MSLVTNNSKTFHSYISELSENLGFVGSTDKCARELSTPYSNFDE